MTNTVFTTVFASDDSTATLEAVGEKVRLTVEFPDGKVWVVWEREEARAIRDGLSRWLLSGGHFLAEPERLRYPGGKDGMWVVPCTCGYRTSASESEARALQFARAHQAAGNREVRRA